MPAAAEEPRRLGTTATLLVAVYAGALLLVGIDGDTRVLAPHEVFAAEPAREMLAGGSWAVPRFAGEVRLKKPPGMSWCIAASFAVFGEREWAARLPSALGGAALAGIVALLAARWFGRRTGILAGLIQATTYYQLRQGRLAEADMLMAAAVAAALCCFALGNVEPAASGRRRVLVARGFWAAAAVSFLLKGVGPIFLLVAVATFAAWTRRRDPLRFLLDPLGLLVFAVAVVAWPLAAWLEHPAIADAWRRETVGRFAGEIAVDHRPFLYLYDVPVLLVPWVPFAIPASWRVARDPAQREKLRFLVSWVVPGLVLLTLSAYRRRHYAIPFLPPFSLLAAKGLEAALGGAGRSAAIRRIALVLVAAATAAGLWAAHRRLREDFAAAAAVIGLASTGLGATIAIRGPSPRVRAALLFGPLGLAVAAFCVLLLPRFDDFRAWADLARRTNALRAPGDPIRLLGLGESQLTFYLDRPVHRLTGADGSVDELRGVARPFLVLTTTRMAAKLGQLGTVETVDRVAVLRRGEPEDQRPTLFRVR